MEKKFVLVCTNEAHEVVGLELFDSHEKAHGRMEKEYWSEWSYDGAVKSEQEMYDDTAYVRRGDDCGYYWQIVKLQ